MPEAKKKLPKRKGTYTVVKPTAAQMRAVKAHIVDTVIRWARKNDHCEEVEGALSTVFGKAPAEGWRDSDGFDCYGYDSNGYNADGFDGAGYHWATGRDRDGYDVEGYDSAGLSRSGRPRPGAVHPAMLNRWTRDEKRALFRVLFEDPDVRPTEKELAKSEAYADAGVVDLTLGQ